MLAINCFKVLCLTDEGMLASTETIRVVARALQDHHVKMTVVDPVCVALFKSLLGKAY